MSTLRFEPLQEVARAFSAEHDWPWQLIGVFPSVDDVAADPYAHHRGFLYVAHGSEPALWCSAESIEERGAPLDLIGAILNVFTLAVRDAVVRPGDNVLVPLGIPDSEGNWVRDADAVFWFGAIEPNDGRRSTWQSRSPSVLPILWSSPLGWKE